METGIVAIHQPDFFPWLGYFNKLVMSDVFVVLDTVQYMKTGSNWSNRVMVNMQGDGRWISMPLMRAYHGVRTYREMLIDDSGPWRTRIEKTLKQYYGKAPYFRDVMGWLEAQLHLSTTSLVEYNLSFTYEVLARLNISHPGIVLASDMHGAGKGTALLISLVEGANGTAYLAGGGCAGYQEDSKFAEAGIELIYQNFIHPAYPQAGTDRFLAGLSIIDVLFNCGFGGTRQLLLDTAGRGRL